MIFQTLLPIQNVDVSSLKSGSACTSTWILPASRIIVHYSIVTLFYPPSYSAIESEEVKYVWILRRRGLELSKSDGQCFYECWLSGELGKVTVKKNTHTFA